MNGLSGWLSIDGDFVNVEYGYHDLVARWFEEYGIVKSIIDKNINKFAHGERLFELLGYIKFVYRWSYYGGLESYVFFPQQFGYEKEVSNKQIQWMQKNYEKVTEKQRQYIQQYLYYLYDQEYA